MNKEAIKAAIETIELQLDALRAAAGLASDDDNDAEEADESDNKTKPERTLPRRRGRAKLGMPRYKADDEAS